MIQYFEFESNLNDKNHANADQIGAYDHIQQLGLDQMICVNHVWPCRIFFLSLSLQEQICPDLVIPVPTFVGRSHCLPADTVVACLPLPRSASHFSFQGSLDSLLQTITPNDEAFGTRLPQTVKRKLFFGSCPLVPTAHCCWHHNRQVWTQGVGKYASSVIFGFILLFIGIFFRFFLS